jgi:hypothetical protein
MLHEIQTQMAAALLGADPGTIARAITGDVMAAAARLRIHRNNLFTALTDALAAHFPVVKRLVGDGFFGYAAHQFIAAHPPSVPCLAAYGETLPDFLDAFVPAAAVPYLADVARLEWAVVAARNAGPGRTIGIERLATVARDDVAALRLILDPGVGYLRSAWPIDAIWQANQPDRDGTLDGAPDADDRCVEVASEGGDAIVITMLDAATWRFRQTLQAGEPLGVAAGAALAVDPLFDLALAINRLFADRRVVALSLPIPVTEGDPS